MDAVARKAVADARHSRPEAERQFKKVSEEFIALVRSGRLPAKTIRERVCRTTPGFVPVKIPLSTREMETIDYTLMRGQAFPRTRLTIDGKLVAFPSENIPEWYVPNMHVYTAANFTQMKNELQQVIDDPRKLQAPQREPFSRR